MPQYRSITSRQFLLATGLLLIWAGSADAVTGMPYRKMAQAAGSLLSARAQARDQKLQLALRRAITHDQGLASLEISPHVFMERGFVVGAVDSTSQAEAVMLAARSVKGLRSVGFYLPVRDASSTNTSESGALSSVGIAASVKAALAAEPGLVATRYELKVVDRHAVLLGVVGTSEERDHVARVARKTTGVTGVEIFLLILEDPYAARRPRLR